MYALDTQIGGNLVGAIFVLWGYALGMPQGLKTMASLLKKWGRYLHSVVYGLDVPAARKGKLIVYPFSTPVVVNRYAPPYAPYIYI